MVENIILQITEKQKQNIEKENKKINAIITEKITENNKTITLNKKALQIFKNSGVELKSYYSYKNNNSLYNTIMDIVKNNSDIFTLQTK